MGVWAGFGGGAIVGPGVTGDNEGFEIVGVVEVTGITVDLPGLVWVEWQLRVLA